MSGEGEVTEEARTVVVSEKEVNTTDLSGERMMESVKSTKEEVKLNTPVPEPHIITFYYSSPPFFPHVSNPSTEEAKENVSGEGEGTEESGKHFMSEKVLNTAAFYGGLIIESVGSSEE